MGLEWHKEQYKRKMGLEWHKEQYKRKMAVIEAKYKKIAEIWHAKGRKAFSDAIYKQEIPNWNDFFEEEWAKSMTIKIKCGRCGYVRDFKIDWNRDYIDVLEEFKGYTALICPSCCDMVEIEQWEVLK